MYETAEQKDPIYDAKGIETVRRDACTAVSKVRVLLTLPLVEHFFFHFTGTVMVDFNISVHVTLFGAKVCALGDLNCVGQ